MSLQPLPSDPALPGLSIASDEEQMREVLRCHLRPLPATDWEIEECRLSRVHYHRAQRCSLRYTLRLVDGRTRHERTQWVTGLIYAGDRAARIWRKLLAADPRREVPEAFGTFEPLAFIPELEMLAQVFPYDRHLPGLARLTLDPPPDLEPVLLAEFGPGDWHIEACRVEPVQYRIGRVAVLRYKVKARTGSMTTGETKCFFAKVYRDAEQAERSHRVLETLWDRRPPAGTGGLTVARPVAYLGDLGVVLQEEVAGRSLQQILLRDADASAVGQAARALAAFRRGGVDGLPRHRLDGEVAVLQRAGQVLGWACPHLRGRVEAVVDAVVGGLDEAALQPTHRELRTDHILLDGDRVAVVDLDSCAASDPVLDPARVLADLAGLPLRLGPSDDGRWEAAAHAFAEEYLRSAPEAWRARLVPHYAGALLKEAVDFFRHLEASWPENVAVLIQEAEDALSGRAAVPGTAFLQ
jgi:hypothetical protein